MLFRRSFEYLDVEINLNCTPKQGPRNCSSFKRKQHVALQPETRAVPQAVWKSPVSTAARQVMGNNLDKTGGVNTSTTGASYIAFRIPGAVYDMKHSVLIVYAE